MIQRFETFVLSIQRIYRCIQRIKSREMTELGLEGSHVMCLLQLDLHREGLTAARLAALTLEDKAAISRVIARLAELELVELEDQAAGRRRYRSAIRLTPAGQAAAARMRPIIEAAVREGGRGLTEAQRETFYRALETIADNLDRICAAEETR